MDMVTGLSPGWNRLGQVGWISAESGRIVSPFFRAMLFGIFMQVTLRDMRGALGNTKLVSLSLVINFLWSPLLAYLLAILFWRWWLLPETGTSSLPAW